MRVEIPFYFFSLKLWKAHERPGHRQLIIDLCASAVFADVVFGVGVGDQQCFLLRVYFGQQISGIWWRCECAKLRQITNRCTERQATVYFACTCICLFSEAPIWVTVQELRECEEHVNCALCITGLWIYDFMKWWLSDRLLNVVLLSCSAQQLQNKSFKKCYIFSVCVSYDTPTPISGHPFITYNTFQSNRHTPTTNKIIIITISIVGRLCRKRRQCCVRLLSTTSKQPNASSHRGWSVSNVTMRFFI